MDNIMAVLRVIMPIFITIGLGIYARQRMILSSEQIVGLQQFVMKFGLPCVLFNSCLNAALGSESVTSMVLVIPCILLSSLLGFGIRRKKYPYHNIPMLFSAQESGMLGIPLFITLFGVHEAYRMGVLDLAQTLIAIPAIAILTAETGKNPSPIQIFGKVIRSPFLIASVLGLVFNLSGIASMLDSIGVLPIITETTGFLAQPVSAAMLFSVGYNFSLHEGYRKTIVRIAGLHFVLFAVICLVMQGFLFLVPELDVQTRWAVLLYCMLPSSYLSPSLGRREEDSIVASGVCSILTATCLVIFCIMAACIV